MYINQITDISINRASPSEIPDQTAPSEAVGAVRSGFALFAWAIFPQLTSVHNFRSYKNSETKM